MSKNATDHMITVEEALTQVLALVEPLSSERVSLVEAAGRVLAADVHTDSDLSPFDSSAMDGYALRWADLAAAQAAGKSSMTFELVGLVGAGSVFSGSVASGQAVRIMTGAPVPPDTDTVVKQEDTRLVDTAASPSAPDTTASTLASDTTASASAPKAALVEVLKFPAPGANVHLHGEDARAGEVVIQAGTVVNNAGVGLLASTGNTMVEVYRRPQVAIFSTGDELVEPEEVPAFGQIRNSNGYSLAASVVAAGGIPTLLGVVRDNPEAQRRILAHAASNFDLVIFSGGASDGDFDYASRVMRELGTLYFNKVNMRPGKAQTLGRIGSTVVFSLPGNPAAALVGFEVLLRPALRKMQGYPCLKRPVTRAHITHDYPKRDPRRIYLRASLTADKYTGERQVTPEKNQSSALLRAMQEGNCLLVLPEGEGGATKGDLVACLRLDIDEGVVV